MKEPLSQQYKADISKIALNKLMPNCLEAPLSFKAVYLSLKCSIYSSQTAFSFLVYN